MNDSKVVKIIIIPQPFIFVRGAEVHMVPHHSLPSFTTCDIEYWAFNLFEILIEENIVKGMRASSIAAAAADELSTLDEGKTNE